MVTTRITWSIAFVLLLALASPQADAGMDSAGKRSEPAAADQGAGAPHNPGVAPINSRPHGKSYSQWAASWWQWALQMNATGHPLLPGGVLCNERQSGKVWFLGGTFTGDGQPVARSCPVPPGTALVVPLIAAGYFAFLNDPADTRTEAFLRAQVECTDASVSVTIDGVALREPTQYLERSVLFDVQLPVDNVFGVDATVVPELKLSPSVDFGYYLFLNPLPRGTHDIQWTARMTCPSLGTIVQNNSYHITVEPPRRP